MRRVDLLDNHFFIFLLLIITAVITTISSIYFFSIMLAGVLFLGFMRCLKQKAYYSLTFIIIAFLFVELNNGFKPFSLTLLAAFTYTFIVPYIKRVISLRDLNSYVYIACFYIGMALIWSFMFNSSFALVGLLLFNLLLDFIIFGFFI